jgi:hypothetical protein
MTDPGEADCNEVDIPNGVPGDQRSGQDDADDIENTGGMLPLGTVSFYDRQAKERSPAVVSLRHISSHIRLISDHKFKLPDLPPDSMKPRKFAESECTMHLP